MEQNTRITLLLQYLEEEPGDAFSSYALALEYLKAGNDEAAYKLMDWLYLNRPDYLPNYYHFGKLLERMELFSKAIMVYEQGIIKAQEQRDLHTLSELRGALEAL